MFRRVRRYDLVSDVEECPARCRLIPAEKGRWVLANDLRKVVEDLRLLLDEEWRETLKEIEQEEADNLQVLANETKKP